VGEEEGAGRRGREKVPVSKRETEEEEERGGLSLEIV